MSALLAYPRRTRLWLSWDTSAPVIPADIARQSGTLPYSSTTGEPLPVLYSGCPCRITRPADGSHVSVPPPRPLPGHDPAYPTIASPGALAAIACHPSAAVPPADA